LAHSSFCRTAGGHPVHRTKAENYDELSLSFKQNLVMIGMQKKLQWIPSHCKIPGNEKADALAKIGAKKKPPP
jgi:ribonuclease HI